MLTEEHFYATCVVIIYSFVFHSKKGFSAYGSSLRVYGIWQRLTDKSITFTLLVSYVIKPGLLYVTIYIYVCVSVSEVTVFFFL